MLILKSIIAMAIIIKVLYFSLNTITLNHCLSTSMQQANILAIQMMTYSQKQERKKVCRNKVIRNHRVPNWLFLNSKKLYFNSLI